MKLHIALNISITILKNTKYLRRINLWSLNFKEGKKKKAQTQSSILQYISEDPLLDTRISVLHTINKAKLFCKQKTCLC